MGTASAARGVNYTFAQALTPQTPSPTTSVPTNRTAAHTIALAPPGKFLILPPGLGLDNFQMKNARMNCEARNEIPASAIVSDICSSIGAPCVEISSAIHHVCRRIGIAEMIAIAMMVTAKNFAMMLRPPAGLCHPGLVSFRPQRLQHYPARTQTDPTSYFALKVKSAVPALPAATVTFCVWVP